jgi:hypothetical protein
VRMRAMRTARGGPLHLCAIFMHLGKYKLLQYKV